MCSQKLKMSLSLSVFIIFGVCLASGKSNVDPCSGKEKKYEEWCLERNQREKVLDAFLQKQSKGLEAFVSGANRHAPGFVPLAMFSVFTDLFPEIWGSDDSFLTPGLTKNVFKPNSKIPLGMAVSEPNDRYDDILGTEGEMFGKSIDMNLVGFNCAACHSGVVRTDSGEIKTLLGAPNTRIDSLIFMMARTSLSDNFTAEKFREALKKKGDDWNIYGDPKMAEESRKDIEFFLSGDVAENWVANVQGSGKSLYGAFKAFLEPKIYGSPLREKVPEPGARKRGTLDAFFTTFFAYIGQIAKAKDAPTDPAQRVAWIREQLGDNIPSEPAETDNPSIWMQRDRGNNHWGGEFGALLPRNLSTAVAGREVPVHFDNVVKITDFTLDLPPPPYPFQVNMKMARAGQALFTKHCNSCHSVFPTKEMETPGKNQYFPLAESEGTSPNRAKHLSPNVLSFLQGRLADVCEEAKSPRCRNEDGTSFRPVDIAQPTQGYQADRLDGIWARAPYRHNGSIPTLEALLIPSERPDTFERGSLDYDKIKVGFVSDMPEVGVTVTYNTGLEGNSKLGHDSKEYLGKLTNGEPVDWKADKKALKELLEFLKTL